MFIQKFGLEKRQTTTLFRIWEEKKRTAQPKPNLYQQARARADQGDAAVRPGPLV